MKVKDIKISKRLFLGLCSGVVDGGARNHAITATKEMNSRLEDLEKLCLQMGDVYRKITL